jgi:TctA family transporter
MKAENIKRADENKTKNQADFKLILPEGISLWLVLGLNLSIFLSAILLNPIAADLAPVIARIMKKIWLRVMSVYLEARTTAERAKGRAKIVWEILIISP